MTFREQELPQKRWFFLWEIPIHCNMSELSTHWWRLQQTRNLIVWFDFLKISNSDYFNTTGNFTFLSCSSENFFLVSFCTSMKTIGFYMPLILSDIFFWQQVACNYLSSLLSWLIAPANLLTRGRHNVQKHLCPKILTICPPETSCQRAVMLSNG